MSNDKEKIKSLLGGDDAQGRSKRKTWALGAACVAVLRLFPGGWTAKMLVRGT